MKPSFKNSLMIVLTLLALTLSALEVAPASAEAATSAQQQKTSPEGLLNPDGTLNLNGSFSGALNLDGWNVQIDPLRGPVFAPAAATAPGQWDNLGAGVKGSLNNAVNAIAVSGTDVYVGGSFMNMNNNGTILPTADYVAKWDTLTGNWSALGSNGAGNGSLGNTVYALAVSGTDLYVGGFFSNVNNNGTSLPAADYVAKWDTLTGNWSALGSNGAGNGSLSNYVSTIAVSGTDVYVGGDFTDVNNNGTSLPAADYVAKWDTLTGNWLALGSNGTGNGSFGGTVRAIAISGTDVYVGGYFTNVNNNGTVLPTADYAAKWDTLTGNWSALGSNGAGNGSLSNAVYTLAVSGTNVYMGGVFMDVNNNGTSLPTADYVAKWDTLTGNWSALGSNSTGNGSFGGAVNTIAVSGTDLYVGGQFTDVNNNGTSLPAADYVAKWDTLTGNWSALGSSGTGNGSLDNLVIAIAVSGADVYVGGFFTNMNNNGTSLPAAEYIAKWDTPTGNWSALGSNGAGSGSLSSAVNAIAVSGTDVYVGGGFTNVNNNGTILYAASRIAKWDTLTGNWSALGSNGAGGGSLDSWVNAIAVSGTDLYVGGGFTDVNNNGTILYAADYVAKWDTLTGNWSALGSNGAGNGSLDSNVYAIAVSGTGLYMGGLFTNVNNNGTSLPAADRIAKWDTLTGNWSALGSNGAGNGSLSSTVSAIAVSGTDLYVGGQFTDVNNNGTSLPTADYVAKWDTLTGNWSALGSNGAGNGSLNFYVNVIAASGTDVYVGGDFTDINNNGTSLPAADYVAKWDTLTGNWSALGSNGAGNGSLSDSVRAIAVSGTDVYVGGYFTNVNNNGTILYAADRIAKWDAAAGNWSALGSNGAGNGSLSNYVSTIAVSGTGVYVGGWFTDVNNNGTLMPEADYIAAYGLPAPAPEMDIKQGSTAIGDGGSYDFGNQALSSNTDVVFAVENTGNIDLTLTTPITIGGADADQFSVISQPASPVAASSSATFTVRFTPTSGGAKTATISIPNNDGDENPYDLTITGMGMPTVAFSAATQTSASESGSLTITAQLSAVSASAVSVPFTVNGASAASGTDYTISASPITIPAGSLSATATITITGDSLDENNETVIVDMGVPANATQGAIITHTATITDDDTAGITVTPTSGLTTTEAGAGAATFTVVLNSQPTADVTVGLTSSDTTEGTVSPASLTFTAANWNAAQTVTVTGVDDFVDDGNVAYTVITTAASADLLYNAINPSDVGISNTDNDAAGITVIPTSGLTTTEAGAGATTFTVVLNSQPTADVTVGLTSSDTTEGTVSPASLTFTAANWNAAQTVTVTGADDAAVDGSVGYTIVTTTTSADTFYGAINPSDVSLSNTDNDVAVERALNGSFENYVGTSKIPKTWKAVKFNTANGDGKDTSPKNHIVGKTGLKVTGDGVKKTLTQNWLPVDGVAGDVFTLSFYVKGSGLPKAGTCQIDVSFFNGTTATGDKVTMKCPAIATFNWKKLTAPIFTTTAAYTRAEIKITVMKSGGALWFDGVSLFR